MRDDSCRPVGVALAGGLALAVLRSRQGDHDFERMRQVVRQPPDAAAAVERQHAADAGDDEQPGQAMTENGSRADEARADDAQRPKRA